MEMSELLCYWIHFIGDEEEGKGLKMWKKYGLMGKDCGLIWRL
jgi:hypothetical protein